MTETIMEESIADDLPDPGQAATRREPERRSAMVVPELGPKIAELRTQRRLSMAELGRRAGVDTSMISRLEASERGATREVIERIADALAASPPDRNALLVAAGYLTVEAARILDDPDLSRLSTLLNDPALTTADRELLVSYVRLALNHAAALGYRVPGFESTPLPVTARR
jgi:transcriptional regulator with XRE-family HTH domain